MGFLVEYMCITIQINEEFLPCAPVNKSQKFMNSWLDGFRQAPTPFSPLSQLLLPKHSAYIGSLYSRGNKIQELISSNQIRKPFYPRNENENFAEGRRRDYGQTVQSPSVLETPCKNFCPKQSNQSYGIERGPQVFE